VKRWALGWLTRAGALLRARALVLASLCLATTAIAAGLGFSLGAGQPSDIPELLVVAAVLLPAVVCQGAVSNDLRSGVALLWLQKPVDPLRFYLGRGLDVCALSLSLTLALGGAAALLGALGSGAEAGRILLLTLPTTLLWAACLGAVVVGTSAWGTQLDGVMPFFVLYLSALGALDQGLLGEATSWIGVPLEAITMLGRFLATGVAPNPGASALRVARFLLVWLAIASLGLLLTTRSPLPRGASD
jgi:hypothetical protein